MGNCVLARVDFRLIHGQVITKWVKKTCAEKIIIVDEDLARDDFMGMIYANAAPKGMSVTIDTVLGAAEKWKMDEYGDGKIMVLFKNVSTCYEAIKQGMCIEKVQLGGAPNEPGKKKVTNEIFLSGDEVKNLKELHDAGIEIYIQAVPEKPVAGYEEIIKRAG
ncbi:PTS sugar transporter subunit IIB [Luxibacter massiliensis]|uniref:PTS sugar transporter subunit IIB n=1 Tax=Luxibacter massiliensis TaxID=2219695 RepID=UPI000F05B680|nr:PTS sugar transporter subunit IIB [Luxibacter massiliensis]